MEANKLPLRRESINMYTDLCRGKVNKLTDPTP